MLCIKCGASLPEGANFCHMCGKKQTPQKRKPLKRPNGSGTVYKLSGHRKRPWVAAKNKVIIGYYEKKTDAGRNRIIPIRPEARDYFAHFAAIATGPLLLSGYSGQRVADNFRNREYYPLLKKLKIKKNPLIPPGTPMPPGLSKRAYLPKCFKQSWAIPTTPQRLVFTTILTQNPSFMQ